MITGDDSRHRAEAAKGCADPAKQLLRVPCRVESQGKVIEGEAVIDTGAARSCVYGDFPRTGETDHGICFCGTTLPVHVADAVLIVAGVEITNALVFPPDGVGALALIGLDVLLQCRFVYEGGRFTLEKI